MAKIGRNDPCSCGSGKKYKRCCLAVHQAAQAAAQAPLDPESSRVTPTIDLDDCDYDELARLSNRVPELIDQGRIDEAEKVCHELLQRFPDVSDGVERLGHVYEVRGDPTTAAAHYRKAATFIRNHGEPEDEHAGWLDRLAARIDPS
jgi:tetratricopeptide (TPR) repeat protein